MLNKVLFVLAIGFLMGCSQLKAQFAPSIPYWERDVYVKRYEDVHGTPIGEISPPTSAYAITYPIEQNQNWDKKNTVNVCPREELKEFATSFTAAVFIHEFLHAIATEKKAEIHSMPEGCYAYSTMVYPEKFKEELLRPMCSQELVWLNNQKMGENRQVRLRKSDAWMEPSLKMAIEFFNSQVGKKVFWYGGLQ